MPFVQRFVEPKYLSATRLHDANEKPLVSDCELEAVTNNTLSNALRQLASLVLVANDIFVDLTKQLEDVSSRSRSLKTRIQVVEERLTRFDPKKVTVPESDISTFATLRDHYVRKHDLTTAIFSAETRPRCLRALYTAAAKTPVTQMRQLDRWRRDGHRTSRYFLCTPVLGAKRRKIRDKIDMDIETRKPAVLDELRRWTSDEALGDITVPPDCVTRITTTTSLQQTQSEYNHSINHNENHDQVDERDGYGALSGDEGVDHKLPSPEEQIIAIANKFPAEIVAVNVSQKRFNRMCAQRKSLLHVDMLKRNDNKYNGPSTSGAGGGDGDVDTEIATTVGCTTSAGKTKEDDDSVLRTRRSRTRRPRSKRRNTISGTDQREIEEAISAREQPSTSVELSSNNQSDNTIVTRSRSSDLLRSSKKEAATLSDSSGTTNVKRSHFTTLKQWGKNRLKMINKSFDFKTSPPSDSYKFEDVDDLNIYETVTVRRRKNIDKLHDPTKPSIISTEKSSNIPISTPISGAMSMAVKLRESAVQRRQRRAGINKDEPHSSSGNWSASSESGRTSIGSEITTSTTTHPKSTTSCGTSSNSLNVPHTTQQTQPSSVASRRKFVNTSNSSSVTSEGTLTPDIIHDLHDDDGESSVYSCDTEGYYTSFHVDSGLKTLKEEDISLPSTPLQITSAFSTSPDRNMSAESEYELFGKGSTSTTTSSAGTVCTTLMASGSQRSLLNGPAVPERKSSLSKIDSSHNQSLNGSLDRNYNIEKTSTIKRASGNKATVVAMVHKQTKGDESPDSGHNTSSSPIESINSPNGQRSYSEFEFSESSDLEGVDRIERIRLKTTINSSRIPSMCVITPPHSDDESVKSVQHYDFSKKRSKSGERQSSSKRYSQPLETDIDADLPLFDTKLENRVVIAPVQGTKKIQLINVNPKSGYATVETYDAKTPPEKITPITDEHDSRDNFKLKSTLQPLNNMLGKLRTNISNLAYRKTHSPKDSNTTDNDSQLYDAGEYVTIADVRNNNKYANDVVKRNLDNILSGQIKDTEYVSLNELPTKIIADCNTDSTSLDSLERKRRQGARVTLDADGKVVYSSDSLRRRKGAHTTFEPGPFVKETTTPVDSPLLTHRTPKSIRPIQDRNRPLSPQMGKIVIRATSPPTSDFIRIPPNTIVTPQSTISVKQPTRGAYVNMQDPHQLTQVSTPDEGPVLFNCNNIVEESNSPCYNSTTIINSGKLPTMSQPMIEQCSAHYNYDRNNSFYQTLPPRKPSSTYRDEMPRSVTPDITRGLSQHPQFTASTPTKQTFTTQSKIPMGISNFFSPILHKEKNKVTSSSTESPKISPIDPRNIQGFKSSTPSKSSDLPAAVDLSNKLSKKSTMSYDELYAVIHKSKKKFNIGTDDLKENCKVLPTPRDRHSWSPNNSDTGQITSRLLKDKFIPDRRIPVAKTSTMDFKRLLLQHGSKSSPIQSSSSRMSAVEQLKLSKPQTQLTNVSALNILDLSSSPRSLTNRKYIPISSPGGSPRNSADKQRVVPKLILSPRSAWRFASPRSDVLSSTILEDCREDESPNNSLEKEKTDKVTLNNEKCLSTENVDEKHSNTTTENNAGQVQSPVTNVRRQIQLFGGGGSSSSSSSNSSVQIKQQKSSPTCNLTGLSRAQYLKAQKEQFFLSSSTTESTQTNSRTIKCPSPPTLETAL